LEDSGLLPPYVDHLRRLTGAGYRCVVYVAKTQNWSGVLSEVVSTYLSIRGKDRRFLLAVRDPGDDSAQTIRGVLESHGVPYSVVNYEDCEKALGSTWDSLVMDISYQFRPNDLGILVEVVRGGGVVIVVGPPIEGLEYWVTDFHKKSVVPPFGIGELRRRFEKRMLEMSIGRRGLIYLADRVELPQIPGDVDLMKPVPRRPYPEVTGQRFRKELYEMCATWEQAELLRAFEDLVARKRWAFVLKANRGRGKSAAIGILAAALMSDRRLRKRFRRILVTAPHPDNARTLFEFAVKGLERLGIRFFVTERNGSIVEVRCGPSSLYYVSPYIAVNRHANLVIVDEAASVPVPILIGLAKRARRAIYSSTVHGYEGAGRGFVVRFLSRLRREFRESLVEFEMSEPIRYPPGDPVEEWLYDVLLLNAEPPEISDDQIGPENCSYVKLERDVLFSRGGESVLRQLVGLLVLTHYRNRPNDIALLGNAPHHFVRALMLPDGRVVNAMHLCYEGFLDDELIAAIETMEKGHMIPAVVTRYYPPLRGFGRLKGIRVVRIATHPALWGRGLGSYAVQRLVEEAREMGMDWVGSGFGATPQLLRFWLRNGFLPIAIGPYRNRVSGEFSVLVVRPLTEEATTFVTELSREFRLRLVTGLSDPYFDLDLETAWLLLRNGLGRRERAELRGFQRERLENYLRGYLNYEGAADGVRALAEAHFLTASDQRLELSELEEKLLLAKTLQGRRWDQVSALLRVKARELMELMRDVTGRLYGHYA